MHDQLLVRVGDGGADAVEQPETLVNRQTARVVVDRFAIDILQGEVRHAILTDAGIEEPRDVGMVESRQDASLAQESLAACASRE